MVQINGCVVKAKHNRKIIGCSTLLSITIFTIVLIQVPYVTTGIEKNHLESLFHNEHLQHLMAFLNSYFEGCDMFFVRERQVSVTSLGQNTYDHVITLTHQPGFNIILTSINSTSPFAPSPRKYHHCSIIISVFLENLEMLGIFDKVLLEGFPTATKPQRDHYIFILPSSSTSELLLSTCIRRKIKLKIVIPVDTGHPSNSNLVSGFVYGKTICIFCNGETEAIKPIVFNESSFIDAVFPDWTRNGQGYKLRITAPTKYHIVVQLKPVGGNLEMVGGQNKKMVEFTMAHFNLSLTIFVSTGDDTGGHHPNGTYSGVIGDVFYGKADMGMCTSYSYYRYPLVGFTKGTMYIWGTFFMGPPKPFVSWKAILSPFSRDMWIGIIISLGGVLGIFHLIQMNKPESHLSAMTITFVLVGQGIQYPKSFAGRLLICTWLFCSLVLSTLYVSKIVGNLAFPELEVQPRNFMELADPKFNYKWGMNLKGGNLYAHFQTSPSSILHKIFMEKEPPKSSEACLNAATERKFACITYKKLGDYYIYKNFTVRNAKSLPTAADQDKLLFVPLGFAVKKNSILLPNFDKVLGSLIEGGHGEKLHQNELEGVQKRKIQWEEATGKPQRPLDDSEENLLALNNLLGVFYMLICGSALSIVLFSFEYLIPKFPKLFRKRRENRLNWRDNIINFK